MRILHALTATVLLPFLTLAQLGPAVDMNIPGVNTQTATLRLADGQATGSAVIGLPPTRPDPEFIRVVLLDPSMNVRLALPDGTVVDQNNGATAGYEFITIDQTVTEPASAQAVIEMPVLLPPGKVITIETAPGRPGGNYGVHVDRSGTTGAVNAIIIYFATGGFSAVPFTPELKIRAGSSAMIGLYLTDNQNPISTATVSAEGSLTQVIAGTATSLNPLGSEPGQPGKRVFSYQPVFTVPGAPLKRAIAYPESATGNFHILSKALLLGNVALGPVNARFDLLLIAQDAGTYVPPDTAATVAMVAREYLALSEPNWGPRQVPVANSVVTKHIINAPMGSGQLRP